MKNHSKGISLVETLVYVTILVLVSLLVVNSLSSLARSYRLMRQSEAIERTAQVALERIGRESRGASSVNTALSTFDSSNGVLTLNTEDENGNIIPVRFYLSAGRVRVEENGVDQGPLSPLDVNVTSLVFRRISTDESEAVRIEMEVNSTEGGEVRDRKFYSTVVLRGSYLP